MTIPVGHSSRPPEQKHLEQFAGPQLILEKTRMVTTNFKLCTMSVWPKNFDVHEQLLLQYYYNSSKVVFNCFFAESRQVMSFRMQFEKTGHGLLREPQLYLQWRWE